MSRRERSCGPALPCQGRSLARSVRFCKSDSRRLKNQLALHSLLIRIQNTHPSTRRRISANEQKSPCRWCHAAACRLYDKVSIPYPYLLNTTSVTGSSTLNTVENVTTSPSSSRCRFASSGTFLRRICLLPTLVQSQYIFIFMPLPSRPLR